MSAWIMAAFMLVAAVGAVMVILHRNPVYSALSLVLTMFALSAIYIMLSAYFIAVVQTLVYAGAIVVLFLFVIMLLNLRNQEALKESLGLRAAVGALLGALFIGAAGGTMWAVLSPEQFTQSAEVFKDEGHTESLARLLFQNHLIPFEAVSLILLAALIGVVVLIRFRRPPSDNSEESNDA